MPLKHVYGGAWHDTKDGARTTGVELLAAHEVGKLAGSRTEAMREVERAKVLLAYAQGQAPKPYSAPSASRIRRSIDK